MFNSLRAKPYYRFILWGASLACLIIMIYGGMRTVVGPNWIPWDDYVEYWASGRLNVTGGNPYNPEELLPLQHQAGRYFGVPVMMWNPPWMLLIAMPFSLIDYPLSRTLWLLMFILIVFLILTQVWRLYGGKQNLQWISWLVGFSFLPTLDALKTGQTGPLLLLGIVGFLTSQKRGNGWIAGAFLSLLAVKPHILYLFGLGVLIWAVEKRQYQVLLGAAGALVGATVMAWIVNPNVIEQYLFAIANYPPDDWATPTVGGFLRFMFGHDLFWMQFIAPVIGVIWMIFYWMRHRHKWDWIERSPLLILISIATAAYGWSSDQTVSLVAILQIAAILTYTNWHSEYLGIVGTFIAIVILMLTIRTNQIYMFWLAPANLLWYIVSMRILKGRTPFDNSTFLKA